MSLVTIPDTSKSLRRRKRSKYSRNGCINCKQIKVKCDETKPSCGRCQRLSKTCEFPNISMKSKVSEPVPSLEPLFSNTMDSVDHDMYLRIDEILSIENEIFDFNLSPTNFLGSELYSHIDSQKISDVHSYGTHESVYQPDELLSISSIWSIPSNLFSKFQDPSHKDYFDIFYDQFSKVLTPIRADDSNPIRDILLSYALRKDYLYYAILASGSRFSYQSSFLERDQVNYSIFMKKTSDMLNDLTFIQNYKAHDDLPTEDEIVSHRLEPLLLTILLLTSDNAASREQTWRGHLRGAKELLQKVFLDGIFPVTRTLIFCKCWFTSFEILAGLGAPYGGTLVQETEIESLVTNVSSIDEIMALKSLKIVNDDNYNYIFGFHNDLLPPLLELKNLIRTVLNSSGQKSFNSIEVFQLIDKFQRHSEIGKSILDSSYSDAGLLTIFTKFLEIPVTNPVNQELVQRILNRIKMLLKDSNPNCEVLLLHWPVLVAGLNCLTERDVIEQFFEILKGFGAGAAKHTLDKIKRSWNNESETDYLDIVTY